MKKLISTLLFAFMATTSWAECYTVYDGANKVIFRSSEAPVDMAYPLSETVPARFGAGASMVVSSSSDNCSSVGAPAADVNTALEKLSSSSMYLTAAQSGGGGGSYLGGGSVGQVIHTGPRGGRYYMNSGGNKTYVSRSGGGGGRRR